MATETAATFGQGLAPQADVRKGRSKHGEPSAPTTRGWLVRRALIAADGVALTASFTATSLFFGSSGGSGTAIAGQYVIFLLTLPVWVFVAKLHELYDRDEERTEHTTIDDFVGVLQLVTLGAWILFLLSHGTGIANPSLAKVATFWATSIAAITAARVLARAYCRHHADFIQNTLIVGAGEVGQLIGRKFAQHPEYGIRLIGFVDSEPRPLRRDLGITASLGAQKRSRSSSGPTPSNAS